MWRLALVVGIVLTGGVLAASATASPSVDHTHLRPAATSVDHPPFCDLPDAPAPPAGGAGATVISFTVLPRGC